MLNEQIDRELCKQATHTMSSLGTGWLFSSHVLITPSTVRDRVSITVDAYKFYHCLPEDGMDQSKWSVPRNRYTLAAKALSGLQRPKFKIQGVWAHGILMKLWVLDPRCPADASTVLETLSRTVEGVVKTCEEKGHPAPRELMVWVACLHSSLSIFVVILRSLSKHDFVETCSNINQ